MDTNEITASQSNIGMFYSMLPRLKHIIFVCSMRIRKGTQGCDACGLKKSDLPTFIFALGMKPWHAMFSSSCLHLFIYLYIYLFIYLFMSRLLFRLPPTSNTTHHPTVEFWVINNMCVAKKIKKIKSMTHGQRNTTI